LSAGHKHFSRWGFGDFLWHKVTGDKGMILGITLRPNSPPSYQMVFAEDIDEKTCLEIELTEEVPTAVTAEGK